MWNSNGTLQTGWFLYKNKWYCLNKKTGAMYKTNG
ncbi:MAG: hypothetical protein ACLTTO_06150 [Lachnospiraceae bacterium]